MKYRKFGKHDVSLSEIGFGAWAIGGGWGDQDDDESIAALHKALDLGVTFIDTAAAYGDGRSERVIGQVLRERKKAGKEENIFVATKTPPDRGPWPPMPFCNSERRYSEEYLRKNIDQRLEMLGTDKLDLLQLHTWTRAWNSNPTPFKLLRKMQEEGKIGLIGVSTPEHDQNSVIDLMRGGWVDSVQVIYNLFEQEPAAELLKVAQECGVGVIVRVAFDEGSLTGKFTKETKFPKGDFRAGYFMGNRLDRTVDHVEKIRADLEGTGYTMAQAALKFVLAHPAVSVVIPGIRTIKQAEMNTAISDVPDMSEELLQKLYWHNWRRGNWYIGW